MEDEMRCDPNQARLQAHIASAPGYPKPVPPDMKSASPYLQHEPESSDGPHSVEDFLPHSCAKDTMTQ